MYINDLINSLIVVKGKLGDIEVQVITDYGFNKIDLINSNSVKILELYFDPESNEKFFTIKVLINSLQKIMDSHGNIDISRMQISHYPFYNNFIMLPLYFIYTH